MRIETYPLSPPSLEELAAALQPALSDNFAQSDVQVVQCPDLRLEPFHLANQGLGGDEKIADVGGRPNLFPSPRLECKWNMLDLARAMDLDVHTDTGIGSLIGAGAGPWHVVGRNCELVPNLSWGNVGNEVDNNTRIAQIKDGSPDVEKSPSLDCALMINLFGSRGNPGPVLKITAKKRVGKEKSFTECIRKGLTQAFGEEHTISLGGAFVIKSGTAHCHIMPDFPSKSEDQQYTWSTGKELSNWLTYHDFATEDIGPIVCLSVLHSSDAGNQLELRMEHTHCASMEEKTAGGHYHGDTEDGEDVEYEGYFNTAKMIYRIDRPEVSLERTSFE